MAEPLLPIQQRYLDEHPQSYAADAFGIGSHGRGYSSVQYVKWIEEQLSEKEQDLSPKRPHVSEVWAFTTGVRLLNYPYFTKDRGRETPPPAEYTRWLRAKAGLVVKNRDSKPADDYAARYGTHLATSLKVYFLHDIKKDVSVLESDIYCKTAGGNYSQRYIAWLEGVITDHYRSRGDFPTLFPSGTNDKKAVGTKRKINL